MVAGRLLPHWCCSLWHCVGHNNNNNIEDVALVILLARSVVNGDVGVSGDVGASATAQRGATTWEGAEAELRWRRKIRKLIWMFCACMSWPAIHVDLRDRGRHGQSFGLYSVWLDGVHYTPATATRLYKVESHLRLPIVRRSLAKYKRHRSVLCSVWPHSSVVQHPCFDRSATTRSKVPSSDPSLDYNQIS